MAKFYDPKEVNSERSGFTGLIIVLSIALILMIVLSIDGIVEGDYHTTRICIFLGIFILIELIFGVRTKILFQRLNRYEMIFEEDNVGVITFSELSEMTGVPEARVRKDILKRQNERFGKIRIEGDKMYLRSYDEISEIICPTCGAVNRISSGSSDKCEYCGSYLRRE